MIEHAQGKIKRIIALRMQPGEDFLKGIEAVCKKENIKNGCILSGIGSLRNATFCDPEVLPNTKSGYGYGEPLYVEGPIEIVSTSGIICHQGDDILLHVHCAFSDKTGNMFGGHLIEGNQCLLTIDMVLAEFEEVDMTRGFDEELGVPIYHPVQL